MDDYIKVSDISSYLQCPRKVYYTYHGSRPARSATQSFVAALLLKEMALSYNEVVLSEDMDDTLNKLLDCSAYNLTSIYREELMDMEPEILYGSMDIVKSWFESVKMGISASKQRFGTGKLLDMLTSRSDETVFYSEKFKISGSPDRVLMHEGRITLSIIRTGQAPEEGIWKDDRIRLTALAILLEEKYGSLVEVGIVEYARFGIIREIKIKRTDRRKVLALAARVRHIKNGMLPQRIDDAPCSFCVYEEDCQVAPTLASRFF